MSEYTENREKVDILAEKIFKDLSKANQKFTKRFNKLEELCNKPLSELTFEEYNELWQKVKKLTKEN